MNLGDVFDLDGLGHSLLLIQEVEEGLVEHLAFIARLYFCHLKTSFYSIYFFATLKAAQ